MQEVVAPHSSDESGELSSEDPVERGGCRNVEPFLGNMEVL